MKQLLSTSVLLQVCLGEAVQAESEAALPGNVNLLTACVPALAASLLLQTFLTCVQGEGKVDPSSSTLPSKASLGRGLLPLRFWVPPPNSHKIGVTAEPLALYDFLRPAIEQHREDFRM